MLLLGISKIFSLKHNREAMLQDFHFNLINHWCYAQRSSFKYPNIMDATYYFYHIFFTSLMLCSKILFFFQTSVMRSFNIFCSMIEHHSFCVLRSSLKVSSIIDGRQILSSICYCGCCYARSSSLQFSNILPSLVLQSLPCNLLASCMQRMRSSKSLSCMF